MILGQLFARLLFHFQRGHMLPDSFSLQGSTFEKRRPGIFIDNTVVIGGPASEIRFRPNTQTKKGSIGFSVTRIFARYNAPDTNPNRKIEQGVYTLSYQGPSTSTLSLLDLEHLVRDFPLVLSAANIKQLIQGGS